MDVTERRRHIMHILRRDRHTTIISLAGELEVSERTVRRDIDALSFYEPIYTTPGRHQGGVYILEESKEKQVYINQQQMDAVLSIVKRGQIGEHYISEYELEQLMMFLARNGVSTYTSGN